MSRKQNRTNGAGLMAKSYNPQGNVDWSEQYFRQEKEQNICTTLDLSDCVVKESNGCRPMVIWGMPKSGMMALSAI